MFYVKVMILQKQTYFSSYNTIFKRMELDITIELLGFAITFIHLLNGARFVTLAFTDVNCYIKIGSKFFAQ